MAKKRKVLIITPGLNYLGGTELETLITAKVFKENNVAEEIIIFSPVQASQDIIEIYKEKGVNYWNYPKFFNNSIIKRLDGKVKQVFKLFKWDFSPLQFIFWRMIKVFYSFRFHYIVTDSVQFYYAPFLMNFKLEKNIIRFTSCYFYREWSHLQKSLLQKSKVINVTAHSQKAYLLEKHGLKNLQVNDVFLWNENNLLNLKTRNIFKNTFGMLSRISREKRLEEGIFLIAKLKGLGVNANLFIQGPPKDIDYLEYLQKLISNLNLESEIIIDTNPLQPSAIPTFFKKIKYFLITSIYEGGPNTGLESMAAGVPVLSYKIGAMPERLEPFKDQLIAEDLQELLARALGLINLDEGEYINLSKKLRKRYLANYSNKSILSSTLKFILKIIK